MKMPSNFVPMSTTRQTESKRGGSQSSGRARWVGKASRGRGGRGNANTRLRSSTITTPVVMVQTSAPLSTANRELESGAIQSSDTSQSIQADVVPFYQSPIKDVVAPLSRSGSPLRSPLNPPSVSSQMPVTNTSIYSKSESGLSKKMRTTSSSSASDDGSISRSQSPVKKMRKELGQTAEHPSANFIHESEVKNSSVDGYDISSGFEQEYEIEFERDSNKSFKSSTASQMSNKSFAANTTEPPPASLDAFATVNTQSDDGIGPTSPVSIDYAKRVSSGSSGEMSNIKQIDPAHSPDESRLSFVSPTMSSSSTPAGYISVAQTGTDYGNSSLLGPDESSGSEGADRTAPFGKSNETEKKLTLDTTLNLRPEELMVEISKLIRASIRHELANIITPQCIQEAVANAMREGVALPQPGPSTRQSYISASLKTENRGRRSKETQKTLDSPRDTENKYKFICEECVPPKTIRTLAGLTTHRNHLHTSAPIYVCRYCCLKVFQFKIELDKHEKICRYSKRKT